LAFGLFTIFATVTLIAPDFMEKVSNRSETLSNFFILSFPFPLNYVLQTIYAFTFLSPAEELLFRGFIQGKLQKWMNVYLAIVIQSVLFGLAHGIPAYVMWGSITYSATYFIIGFFGGMLLGIGFYKTGNNIVAPWFTHAVSDSPLSLQ